MPSIRRLLLAALAIGVAASASVCDDDFTIESDGDVAEIASCKKLDGTLTVGKKTLNVVLPQGLTSITGDLVADGAAGLGSFEAPTLATIGGSFTLKGLTVLGRLSFPNLVSVGDISWATLPALSTLDFTKEITKAKTVLITDTYLSSLRGINLEQADRFNINNNRYLKTVDVALGNVTDLLIIEANGKGVVASFPDLKWANNITIRDAGEVSFPVLEEIRSSAAFVNNTFSDLALPELTEVGESLAFISNSQLTNLTVNSLTEVGGTFQIANNTKLDTVDGFEKLAVVGGAIDLSGTFSTVELPSLDDVRGGFNLQSTNNVSCTSFKELQGGVVKGDDFTCEGSKERAESKTAGLGTGSGSSAVDDEDSAASKVGFSMLAVALVGAVMAL